MDYDEDRFPQIELYSGDPLDGSQYVDDIEIRDAANHIAEWLSSIIKKRVDPSLTESLSDGTVLCEMYQYFFPKARFKYHKHPFNNEKKKIKNIYTFNKYCMLLGIQACSTIDYSFFTKRQLNKIVLCLFRFIVTLISLNYVSKLTLPERLYSQIQIYSLYYGYVIEEDQSSFSKSRSYSDRDQSQVSKGYLKSNSRRIHKFYHEYYDNSITNPLSQSHSYPKWRMCLFCLPKTPI